jgi:ubiquinone/menaquinone biosynthesis C-methylase UbiE
VQSAGQQSCRVARASIQSLPFPAQRFHLVTSFEVLYHLAVHDDVAALREFARVLRPGGWLLLRVPAHDWLRGAHDRHVHTRHRYDKAELRRKLIAANFSVQRLTYVGACLFPLAVARRAWQRAESAQTDVTLPGASVNAALTRLLAAEGPWLRKFDLPMGLSVLAVARKS